MEKGHCSGPVPPGRPAAIDKLVRCRAGRLFNKGFRTVLVPFSCDYLTDFYSSTTIPASYPLQSPSQTCPNHLPLTMSASS